MTGFPRRTSERPGPAARCGWDRFVRQPRLGPVPCRAASPQAAGRGILAAAGVPLCHRDVIATRRPAECACARISCTGNIGPHGRPPGSDGPQQGWPSAQAGAEEKGCRLGARGPGRAARAGCCRAACFACRPARGDSRQLLLVRPGGDAEGELTRARKSGSPRLAANLRGRPECFRLRDRAWFFVLRRGSYGMTVPVRAFFAPCPRDRFPVTHLAFPSSAHLIRGYCPGTARARALDGGKES
jgi:hypothetical protein